MAELLPSLSPASIMGPPWRHKHGTTSGLHDRSSTMIPVPIGSCQAHQVWPWSGLAATEQVGQLGSQSVGGSAGQANGHDD